MSNIEFEHGGLTPPTERWSKGVQAGTRPAQLVANNFGIAPFRQFRERLALRIGAQKLSAAEYYDLRVFDPVHDHAAKSAFLGARGIASLNEAINPEPIKARSPELQSKLSLELSLRSDGLPCAQTQAIVTQNGTHPDMLSLTDANAIEWFLRNCASYPIVAKPNTPGVSDDVLHILGLDGDRLRLSGGETLWLDAFCEIALSHIQDGYLLQTCLRSHPEIAQRVGATLSTVRIVSINNGTGVQPLYAVWKIPGPKALTDTFDEDGAMLALLDIATGTALRCHQGKGPTARFENLHPVSGQVIQAFRLPYWEEALNVSIDVHEQHKSLAIFGVDVAITPSGPVVLGATAMPDHNLYQYPARQGILNRGFRQAVEQLLDWKR